MHESLYAVTEEGNLSDDEIVGRHHRLEACPWRCLPPTCHLATFSHLLVGSGMQLVFMCFGLLLVLSCFGVLNPSFRGGFVSVGIRSLPSSPAVCLRLLQRPGIQDISVVPDWRYKMLLSLPALFPGLAIRHNLHPQSVCLVSGVFSTAIPLGTLFGLVRPLGLFIQLPLVYAGSYHGFLKGGSYSHPIKANAICHDKYRPQAVVQHDPVQAGAPRWPHPIRSRLH